MDTTLLYLLACPQCRGTLDLLPQPEGLHCKSCCLVYPVEDGIPLLLPEEGIAFSLWLSSKKVTPSYL